MAKIHARNVAIFADGRDITGRSNTLTLTQNADAPDATAFQNPNRERLHGGITDIELSLGGFYDSGASQVDALFSSLLAGSAWYGVYPEGATGSLGGREFEGILTEYSQEYSTDAAAAISSTIAACGTMYHVTSLGYGTTVVTSASTNPSVDFSGSSASNYCFLRVVTLVGTTPEITACLQHSSNDSAWTTAVQFTTASAANQVITGSFDSASRYRRVTYVLAGTSPCATFLVSTGSFITVATK